MTIQEGNKLIADFVGPSTEWNDSKKGKIRLYCKYDAPTSPNCEEYELKYHSSWDWLMPACKKWDTLENQSEAFNIDEYVKLCEELDELVSCYEIEPVFWHFVKCITWYNTQNNN